MGQRKIKNKGQVYTFDKIDLLDRITGLTMSDDGGGLCRDEGKPSRSVSF